MQIRHGTTHKIFRSNCSRKTKNKKQKTVGMNNTRSTCFFLLLLIFENKKSPSVVSHALFLVFFHAIQSNGIAWMDGLLCDVTAAKQHSKSQKIEEKKKKETWKRAVAMWPHQPWMMSLLRKKKKNDRLPICRTSHIHWIHYRWIFVYIELSIRLALVSLLYSIRVISNKYLLLIIVYVTRRYLHISKWP